MINPVQGVLRHALFGVGLFSSIALCQNASKQPLVAVMPLTGQGLDEAASQVVTDALADELLKTGKVRVMERSQMEKILKEQGFQQSGSCNGSECAVEMGKLLSIDKMVVGSLGKLGNSYSLSVRSVDVATGEVLGSSRRQQKGEIDDVTSGLLPSVAAELANSINGRKAPSSVPTTSLPTSASSIPKTEPLPSSASAKQESSSHWGWWAAGGAVVAGGTVAAILLTSKKSAEASTAEAPPTQSASWNTLAEW